MATGGMQQFSVVFPPGCLKTSRIQLGQNVCQVLFVLMESLMRRDAQELGR